MPEGPGEDQRVPVGVVDQRVPLGEPDQRVPDQRVPLGATAKAA